MSDWLTCANCSGLVKLKEGQNVATCACGSEVGLEDFKQELKSFGKFALRGSSGGYD